MTRLRYDGKYRDFPGDTRQWTLISSFVDENGNDRIRGSFSIQGLKEIGLLKGDNQHAYQTR